MVKRSEAQIRADRKYESTRYERTTKLVCTVPKDIADEFKSKLSKEGLSVNKYFTNVVKCYLEHH